MKKKSNAIIYIIILLLCICLIGGIIGLLSDKSGKRTNENGNNNENDKKYTVTYKYYLDDEEVETPIVQETVEVDSEEFEGVKEVKDVYTFKEYRCTNNVEGVWNNDEWTFTPNLTATTTCRLYFIKNFHNVTFTTINGVLPNNAKEQVKTVQKDKETVINILPVEGYKYADVNCTNNAVAEYNVETHDLVIKEAIKDSSCTISFEINDFKAELKVSNGTVKEDTKTANYGENIEFEVTPSENYGNPTVLCTNNQKATYEDGKVTITGISNDTVCTIQYKPIKFNVSLKVNNGSLLSKTPSPQSVINGGTARFGISADTGYKITGAEAKCNKAGIKIEIENNTVAVYDVSSDLSCEITLKADE